MKTRSLPVETNRRDRLLREHIHDPYKTKHKPPEPTVCPVCNAVFHGGRWIWTESWPVDAHKETCQACHRTMDNYPAGVMTLSGTFALAHKEEIIELARHHERRENSEHPLHRIMRVSEQNGMIVIETTDIHLPHRIAEALRHAYKGELHVDYNEEGYFVRVSWTRET